MTSPLNVDLMSPFLRERYEEGAPERLDPFSLQSLQARDRRRFFEEAAENVRWFEGNQGSLVAWHNSCPLIVSIQPTEHRRLAEPGQPFFGHSHSIVISGHLSSSSPTLAGAIQEATMQAVEHGHASSDSRWLNSKGGRKGFFESHGVDERKSPSRTLVDYMVPEHMRPIEVDAEETLSEGFKP